MALASAACGGSSDATGCGALSACCATLSGADGEECQAAVQTNGVTDAACTQALSVWQSAGLCEDSSGDADGGGFGAPSEGCGALSACCATLSANDAEECQAAAQSSGVTDAECTKALTLWQSEGLCEDGGGSSGSADAGGATAVPADTGCAALGSCCPDLPVAEDPMGCLTVAMEGTPEACQESLATYQEAGYCVAGASGIGSAVVECYSVVNTASFQFCTFVESDQSGFSCAAAGGSKGLQPGTCPSANLFGCCTTTQIVGGTSKEIAATCYYDETTANAARSTCTGAGTSWTPGTP